MKKIFIILCVCAVAVSATAVPARRDGILRTAANGTEKTVYLHGNENFHYMTDAEGNWLDEETLAPMSEEAKVLRLEAGRQRVARRAKQETGTSRLLAPRGAVLLVEFNDKEFSNSKESMIEWATAMNYTEEGATGSIREYFYDQSFGQYDLQLDVYGPYKISQNASYYGKNDSDGNDQHADEMVVEACQLAFADSVDFSQYDYNNDGEVDWVVVVYAGKGEADGGATTTIWPHQYELSYTNKSFEQNGKTINRYCCVNEISGQGGRSGIGVFVHEFSHILGLPDLYTTNNATHKTMGMWDIMDYGPYNNDLKTPPAYSAYERWWMGWLEPTQLTKAATVTMPDLSQTQAAAYITADGEPVTNILRPNPNVFYMLENRQQNKWDEYIPGSGLLVTKINYRYNWWHGNTVNNTASNMGVDLIEADGSAPAFNQSNYDNGYFGKATDAYPAGATEFTAVDNYQVTNIVLNGGVITFDVNGGGEAVVLDVENVEGDNAQGTKVLRDGQLVIERGGKSYDVMGRLVD